MDAFKSYIHYSSFLKLYILIPYSTIQIVLFFTDKLIKTDVKLPKNKNPGSRRA